ncbi:hypothetical protein D5282_09000 [bacterium 1xD8-48]|nr:hypothetical protein [bacterium 1xD8-48]
MRRPAWNRNALNWTKCIFFKRLGLKIFLREDTTFWLIVLEFQWIQRNDGKKGLFSEEERL